MVAKLEGNHMSLPVWAMIRIQPQVPVLTTHILAPRAPSPTQPRFEQRRIHDNLGRVAD